jgi:hypothetical protein
MGQLKTAICIGAIFGLFHIFIEKIPIVTLMGILLTWVCLRSGSIFPAMLIHAANNGLQVLLSRSADVPGWLSRSLETIYGPIVESAESTVALSLDMRTAAFMGMFLIGLAVISRRNSIAN